MKENVLKFKRPDTERIYERANANCDDGNYVGALSSLIYESEKHPENADIHAHIADIYTELGLFENAIYHWFLYLSKSKKKYYIDGYNGLGANFYFLDNKFLAGYYFKKQTECGDDPDCVYQDVLEDYLEDVSGDIRDSYRVVKSQSREEEEERALDRAEELNDKKDYEGALKILSGISPESPLYIDALSESARSEYYLGDEEKAAEYALKALSSGDDDPFVYSVALSSLDDLGRKEEFRELYRKFKAEKYAELSDRYKKLSTMCEFGFEKDANAVADEILSENPNDANTCFIKGMLSYNAGDIDAAQSYLTKAYILTGSPIAKYYQAEAAACTEERFPLVFDIPEREAEERLNLIKSIFDEGEKAKGYSEKRLLDIAEWVFAGNNSSLQVIIGIIFLMRSKNERFVGFIFNQLLSPSLTDDVKHKLIAMLCERGYSGRVSVVYGNVFRTLKIPAAQFSEEGGKLFLQAFAFAFGRLSLVYDGSYEKFAKKASEFQKAFLENSAPEKISSLTALSCAMYLYSGLDIIKEELCYGFFSADARETKDILVAAVGPSEAKKE